MVDANFVTFKLCLGLLYPCKFVSRFDFTLCACFHVYDFVSLILLPKMNQHPPTHQLGKPHFRFHWGKTQPIFLMIVGWVLAWFKNKNGKKSFYFSFIFPPFSNLLTLPTLNPSYLLSLFTYWLFLPTNHPCYWP